MNMLDFTAEEVNLIAMYGAETKEATISNISGDYPDMDEDMKMIASNAADKLAKMAQEDFIAVSFIPADDAD